MRITNDKRIWLILGVVGICAVCCFISVIASVVSSGLRSAQAPTRTPRPTLTSTPIPTIPLADTPSPTNTPEPTASPEPTPTEVAAAPQQPDLSTRPDIQAYFLTVTETGQGLAEALSELGRLLQDAKLEDENWVVETALQVVIIRNAHKTLEETTPPAEMAEFHEFLIGATGDCSMATDHLTLGIDNRDTNELALSSQFLQSCGEEMSRLPDELSEALSQMN